MAAPHEAQAADTEVVAAGQEKPKSLWTKILDKISAGPKDEQRQKRLEEAGVNNTGETPAVVAPTESTESQRLEDLKRMQAAGVARIPSAQREQVGTGAIKPEVDEDVAA
jgi:hypothetical protein